VEASSNGRSDISDLLLLDCIYSSDGLSDIIDPLLLSFILTTGDLTSAVHYNCRHGSNRQSNITQLGMGTEGDVFSFFFGRAVRQHLCMINHRDPCYFFDRAHSLCAPCNPVLFV
jgi:hypothetical protein